MVADAVVLNVLLRLIEIEMLTTITMGCASGL